MTFSLNNGTDILPGTRPVCFHQAFIISLSSCGILYFGSMKLSSWNLFYHISLGWQTENPV